MLVLVAGVCSREPRRLLLCASPENVTTGANRAWIIHTNAQPNSCDVLLPVTIYADRSPARSETSLGRSTVLLRWSSAGQNAATMRLASYATGNRRINSIGIKL